MERRMEGWNIEIDIGEKIIVRDIKDTKLIVEREGANMQLSDRTAGGGVG